MSDRLDYFLPYQRAWLDERAPLAIAEKSRRTGWTYVDAYASVEAAIAGRHDVFFSSADFSAAKEYAEYCSTFARLFQAVAEHFEADEVIDDESVHVLGLRFASGKRIVCGSSNPKFFRSKGGAARLDEFAFHVRGRDLYKAAHATALFWGYPLRLWSTHNGEGSYFNGLLTDAKGGRLRAAVHRVTILDAVEQGIVEKIRGLKGPDATARREWLDELRATCPDEQTWAEEYLCVPGSDASAYLSYETIRAATADNLRTYATPADLPEGRAYYAGYDVGRRHDLSVLWVLEKVGDVWTTRMLRVLDRQSFAAQASLLHALMSRRDVKRLCVDETGLGMMLAETLADRYGGRVEGVTLSGPVKATLGARVKDTFADARLRMPRTVDWETPADDASRTRRRDDWLVEDLHKTRRTVTAAGNVRLHAESDADGHADAFWALALALEAADDARRPMTRSLATKPEGW